jgi:hypothetical protein
MPLKVAIAQQAARTSTGTQNFTDSNAGFNNDVHAAIFISSRATATHTDTAGAQLSIGIAARLGGNVAIGEYIPDNTSIAAGPYVVLRTADAYSVGLTDASSDAEFTVTDWDPAGVTNGIEVTYSDTTSYGELITALLIGGDIEAKVVTASWGAETGAKTVTHGLSAAPEVIIAIAATRTSAGGALGQSIGFWANSAYAAKIRQFSNASELLTGHILTSAIAGVLVGGTSDASVSSSVTLSGIGSTQFTATASASTTLSVHFLCLRGTTTPITAKCGVYDSYNTTGDHAMGLSLGVAPQALLLVPSIQTATGGVTDDSAGGHGLLAAAKAGSTYQHGGSVDSTDRGLDPTDTHCQTTAAQALRILGFDGSVVTEAVVKTSTGWGSSDITLNYSTGSTAYKIPYLAFGIQAATKYLKLLAHSSAASATDVEGVVLNAARDTVIGEFSGQAFEATLESGEAVLLIPTADITPDGDTLTTSDTPIVVAYNATDSLVGPASATVIEV